MVYINFYYIQYYIMYTKYIYMIYYIILYTFIVCIHISDPIFVKIYQGRRVPKIFRNKRKK